MAGDHAALIDGFSSDAEFAAATSDAVPVCSFRAVSDRKSTVRSLRTPRLFREFRLAIAARRRNPIELPARPPARAGFALNSAVPARLAGLPIAEQALGRLGRQPLVFLAHLLELLLALLAHAGKIVQAPSARSSIPVRSPCTAPSRRTVRCRRSAARPTRSERRSGSTARRPVRRCGCRRRIAAPWSGSARCPG